jgi:pSer/pThr/pTyr-binding forkhead associated (FHA) protein/anti-anti-sigma regulatory factor
MFVGSQVQTAYLRVLSGRTARGVIPVQGPRFVIGLALDCHLRLGDLSVAERHCEITIGDDYLAVRDLGSREGTRLNGLRIVSDCTVRTRHGDRIQVGDSVFEIVLGEMSPGDLTPGVTRELSAAIAERLLHRRLGPRRDLTPSERNAFRSGEVAGIPILSVRMSRIVDREDLGLWRAMLRNLVDLPDNSRIIIEIRSVKEFSAEAADVLLALHERVSRQGTVIKLCEVDPEVMRILKGLGIDTVIPVHFDACEAAWSK